MRQNNVLNMNQVRVWLGKAKQTSRPILTHVLIKDGVGYMTDSRTVIRDTKQFKAYTTGLYDLNTNTFEETKRHVSLVDHMEKLFNKVFATDTYKIEERKDSSNKLSDAYIFKVRAQSPIYDIFDTRSTPGHTYFTSNEMKQWQRLFYKAKHVIDPRDFTLCVETQTMIKSRINKDITMLHILLRDTNVW